MKTSTFKSVLLTVSVGICLTAQARENVNDGQGHRLGNSGEVLSNCTAGKTQTELKLNDVRTRILTDGDMWWDLNNARYEVPKGSNSMAQFAGSLWFGGYHNGGLRISAMTYRQNGIDFWPGPLDPATVNIDPSVCASYDKHFVFNRADVDNFYAYWAQHQTADPNTPSWIKEYPGTYDYQSYGLSVTAPGLSITMNYLAPFHDNNGDGLYNYADGDYPNYNVKGSPTNRGECVRRLFGDQTIFWVFNDKGNKHTETGGNAIGVEIRAQAFEFATGDELNQMSFYNYEVINWSTDKLDSTYFTVWDDCDLGNYQDDYIGCDVKRGLGYQYNGDNYDEDFGGFTGYHDKLPAIGCDFFQGPYADVGDGLDNDRDSCLDCTWQLGSDGKPDYSLAPIKDNVMPEQIIMSRFTYYTNTGDPKKGNPNTNQPAQYYNFMSGRWKDGSPMTYGGDGTSTTNPSCAFLFPGTSDPNGWGLGYQPGVSPITSTPANWTQQQAGVVKNDMRFLQSCGKFTLQPGAVNYVTYGIPFVRSNSADNMAPIPLLQTADDKAQALFDNCFKVLDGPDAPDITIQELSNQLLFTLSNSPFSNNYEAKRYAEVDPTIQPVGSISRPDNQYRFEGYLIYQLKDETVGPSDLYNADKARLVFQCDVRNGVKQLINYVTDQTLGLVPQLMVNGADAGIQNSFTINSDQFASSDPRLINFKNYYFMAISYAYNNFLTYVPNTPPTATVDTTSSGHSPSNPGISFTDPSSGDYNGQKKPFLSGRRNIRVYTGIPHDPSPESYGTVMNSSYGIGPQITRIEGQGNGGNALDLTDASINDIMNPANNGHVQNITYAANRGPIKVKVTDPLRVVKGDFKLKFVVSNKVKVGPDSLWQYFGNPPAATTSNLDTGVVKNQAKIRWYMTGNYTDNSGNHVSKTWLSDEGINFGQEKIITGVNNEPLGFSITIRQTHDPYTAAHTNPANTILQYGSTDASDLLESSMTFANTSTPWLSGVDDQDGNPYQDWILSGGAAGDVSGTKAPGKYFYADAAGVWEKVVNATWAPARFVKFGQTDWSPLYVHSSAAATSLNPNNYAETRLLSSVDVVFTNDKSKWTHCPVVDMNPATDPATSLPYKWQLRRHKSVDQNGDTLAPGVDPVADSSMSWFPGYAINVETGERLSMMFSENSADVANRGNDMMWNPTRFATTTTGTVTTVHHGGMHYVYVFGHNADGNYTIGSEVIPSDVRRYDQGLSLYKMLTGLSSWPRNYNSMGGSTRAAKWELLSEVFKDLMWVTMPLSANGIDIGKPSDIPCDVKVRIRVNKPYRYGTSMVTSAAHTSKTVATAPGINSFFNLSPLDSIGFGNGSSLTTDVVTNSQNGNFPMYTFNTNDLAPKSYDQNTATSALAKINIVPNPYYGHSAYEKTRIDNLIKIINLPVKCKIRIYTLAGTLIRTIEKDNDQQTYVTWDLKNDKNIQIASGLYIIHIDAPGIGERILKWFGVLRPYDLQSY
ncbi:MAG: T9SS type A sorting domain-containing protein [Bacteroidia bacterium]